MPISSVPAPDSAQPTAFGPPDRVGAAKESALAGLVEELRASGADAVVGIGLDDETAGESMLMISASGARGVRGVTVRAGAN